MMGERKVDQAALFYEFSVEQHVPAVHMLRAVDRFVDLAGMREHLKPFYSAIGRPSIEALSAQNALSGKRRLLGRGP
jgi:hypothetical protein